MKTLARSFARYGFAMLVLAMLAASATAGDVSEFRADAPYTWRSTEPAFAVTYPWHWERNHDARPPIVHEVAHPDLLPALRIMVLDEPFWLPLSFATRAASTQLGALGSDIELVSEELVELADGLEANVGEVRWRARLGHGVPVRSLFVHRFIADRWVIVNLTVADRGSEVPAHLRQIALSLSSEAQ